MVTELVVLVLFLGVFLTLILMALRDISRNIRRVEHELKELRLTSRTRVRVTGMRNTEMTEEQKLVRLGRSSRAKRVVVGGDEDSPLHTNLGQSVGGQP